MCKMIYPTSGTLVEMAGSLGSDGMLAVSGPFSLLPCGFRASLFDLYIVSHRR